MAKLIFELIGAILMLTIGSFCFAFSILCAVNGKIQLAIYLLLMALLIESIYTNQYLIELIKKQDGDNNG